MTKGRLYATIISRCAAHKSIIREELFSARVNRDEAETREVIDATRSVIKHYVSESNVNLMLFRHTGHLVFAVSCMYDRLCSYLTEEEKHHTFMVEMEITDSKP